MGGAFFQKVKIFNSLGPGGEAKKETSPPANLIEKESGGEEKHYGIPWKNNRKEVSLRCKT